MFLGFYMPSVNKWDYVRCRSQIPDSLTDGGFSFEVTDHISRTKPYFQDVGATLANIPLDDQQDWFARKRDTEFEIVSAIDRQFIAYCSAKRDFSTNDYEEDY